MNEFWTTILVRINAVSESLQSENIELQTAIWLLNLLLGFLKSQRDNFDYYEQKACELKYSEYSDESKWKRARKWHFDDGDGNDVVLQGAEKFKIETYLPILDQLIAELSRRLEAYETVHSVFGILYTFPTFTDAQLKEGASKLLENYPDVVEPEFRDELVHFKYFMDQLEDPNREQVIPASQSYKVCNGATTTSVVASIEWYRKG